jgi:hypothetical protein
MNDYRTTIGEYIESHGVQTGRKSVEQALVKIAAGWGRLGITDPVIDSEGRIHDDAVLELNERL